MQFLINFSTMKSSVCLWLAFILLLRAQSFAKLAEENEPVVQVWCGEHIPKLITTRLEELTTKIESLEQKLLAPIIADNKMPDIEKIIANSVKEHYAHLTLEKISQIVLDMQKNQNEILTKLTTLNQTMTKNLQTQPSQLEKVKSEGVIQNLNINKARQNLAKNLEEVLNGNKNLVKEETVLDNQTILTLLQYAEREISLIKLDVEAGFTDNQNQQSSLRKELLNRIDEQFERFYYTLALRDSNLNENPYETKSVNLPKVQEETYEDCHEDIGVFKLKLPKVDLAPFDVYCFGGNWTIIQRRQDGSIDFYRDWLDYKNGFGNVSGEYWLGLEKIYIMTSQRHYELWITLVDHTNETRDAFFSHFEIGNESERYYLKSLGSYEGDAGNSLGAADISRKFTTRDLDNDSDEKRNCAVAFGGAWWYNNCNWSDLNAQYNATDIGKGINWSTFRGFAYSLKYVHMALRVLNE